MSNTKLNLSALTVDENGRVKLEDATLVELEKDFSATTAGGTGDEDEWTPGMNPDCFSTNPENCNGETNYWLDCRNSILCRDTLNIHDECKNPGDCSSSTNSTNCKNGSRATCGTNDYACTFG